MSHPLICDICQKEIKKLDGKIWLTLQPKYTAIQRAIVKVNLFLAAEYERQSIIDICSECVEEIKILRGAKELNKSLEKMGDKR